ncbi:MAG: chorismate mutase [Deltaproteobacteria bacterium]|nr:chorismate mutase [Deltaproteobacteria bacterium]
MIKKRVKPQSLEALRERRKQIDLIDQKLLSLLNRRLSIALEIGKIKRERREKVYNPKREDEILKRLNLINRGPLKEEDLKKIFKKIMMVCRKSQNLMPR